MSPRFDAVVVGAGAGGSAAAWRLTEHGLRVLVLEAGPRFDPTRDYRLHRPDWELGGFPHQPRSAGRVSFGEFQPLDPHEDSLHSWNRAGGQLNRGERREVSGPGYHHVRGVGGSTLHFTGEAHRLHPAAMRMYSDFGVAADWPITYADLEPYYVIAERLIGVAGPDDHGDRWRSAPYPLPAHPLCKASAYLVQGAAALGLRFVANSRAALSRPYDGRPACNYCANCARGCPIGDKGSADVTFIRRAERSGRCELRPGAAVTRLEMRRNGTVGAVRYVRRGRGERVETPILVLAAGAVETPRLLLANRSQTFPDGAANGSGQVGRHFMETLHWVSTGLAAEPLNSFQGLPADAVCWDFNRPDRVPGVPGGCRFTSAVLEAGLVGPIAYASRIVAGFGAQLKQGVRDSFGRALSVGAIGEFLPNEHTFVTLDTKERDALGLPLAKIHSHITATDVTRLRFMAETCRRILRAAGASELVEEFGAYDLFSATHVFGTCRMGTDSRSTVVDAFGRAHESANLYITDASVFPSSGGGEAPSLTIEALAIRSADRIATESVLPPSPASSSTQAPPREDSSTQ